MGVSFGVGAGSSGLSLDIAASRGKGQANSDSTTYNNSHVSAGNAVNITSGADTNLNGGNVKANQATANVGGNLNVESLQDIAVSEANQKTTGIALSIPIVGTGGSASFSQSKQNSNSNYASVNEQSGIKAGEGGFTINVGGNTDLKGATVTGSSDASKNTLTTNTLTTSDINNSMSASASSSGVSVGTNMMDGKYAMAKAIAGNILVGAVTGFGQTAATKESLAAAADEMRALMVKDSSTFAGVVDSTGKKLSNNSGSSEGINGDGMKLGGTRVDLDLLCGPDNSRCEIPKRPDGSVDTSKPMVFTGGRNDDGTPKQTIDQFLTTDEGQKMAGTAGGVQGAEGSLLKGTIFGSTYTAGSWQDKLVEAFAGSHDVIGGTLSGLYDDQGNATRGRSPLVRNAQDTWSATGAIVGAAPFAAAQGFSPEVWKAISIFLNAAK